MTHIQLPESVKESLKQLSIKGRMALATTILETVLSRFKITNEEKDPLINIFWQFVEEEDLAKWDDDRRKITVLMDILDFFDLNKNLPSESSVYTMPRFILEMIYKINRIGSDDLYSAVQSYSQTTHTYTIQVLELALCNGFVIPLIEPFLKLHFAEEDGWGKSVPRAFFRDNIT